MEFLSATANEEYSQIQDYPPGKWYFYEQILRVPTYAIFQPATGRLEINQLNSSGNYQPQQPDASGRYWIPGVGLFLGVWYGTKAERTGYWLRWWDESGQMLLWGAEMVERERQERVIAQQQAEQERERSSILAAQLRALGKVSITAARSKRPLLDSWSWIISGCLVWHKSRKNRILVAVVG